MKKFKSVIALLLAVLMFAGCFATAYAAENEEKEPNNDVATATEFAIGKEIAGVLGNTDDVDNFKFKAEKSGLAKITFAHAAVTGAAGSYFEVTVKNADGLVVAKFESAGVSTSDSAEILVIAGTEYIVEVNHGDVFDGSVTYTINVTVNEAISTETEPNNTVDKATVLALSTSGAPKYYYGATGTGDDDFYKITVPSNGVLNLYLYNDFTPKSVVKAELVTYVEGSDGTQKLENVTSITMTVDDASKIGPSVCVPAGDYILKITGEGSYKTRVLFRAASNTESEMNDSAAQADKIDIGTAYKATLDEANDKDYFEFTAAADNKGYDINFKATSNGQWKVRVLNSSNDAVADTLTVKATDSSKTAKLETKPLSAGSYYIEVVAGDAHNSDIYEISVSAKEASIVPEPEKNLIDKIKDLNWNALLDNFKGWFEQIDIMGMISSMFASIAMVIALLTNG
ncbi:MAG: hypothetical protein U0L11_03935 [Acutalibacteraceae bacterium]|nr:hypothetical protein [Acutalibacteraceae bacterium]